MAYLSDWNFQILSSLSGDIADISLTLRSMQYSYEAFGIRKFLLLAPYEFDRPLSLHLLMWDSYCKELKKALPKPLILQTASRTTLREGLSGNDGLERLLHKQSGYLPLFLPISAYEDWMDAELNRLLYTRHIKPLFLSFELALILYPNEIVEKLMRISSAAFQFGYKSLIDPKVQQVVKSLLQSKKPVLLGTGWNAFDKCLAEDLLGEIDAAKLAFSKAEWDTLLKDSRAFGRQ